MLGNVLTASIISKFLFKKNIRWKEAGIPVHVMLAVYWVKRLSLQHSLGTL